jgi:hypothetical protein
MCIMSSILGQPPPHNLVSRGDGNIFYCVVGTVGDPFPSVGGGKEIKPGLWLP